MNKSTQFSKDEIQAAIQVAQSDLIDFAILTHHNYKPNWHHVAIANALMRVERGEIDRLLLMVPPRHGKSELASIRFPAWYLGRDPHREVITSSYSADLATDFGSKTRHLIESEQYQAIFPNVQLRNDERAKGKWLTKEGGGYTSVGVGGPITGRGATLLSIDDPIKNREEAESKVYRDKIWDWYTSTAYTRLEKGGAVVLTLTRWHMDDLAGRILASEDASRWEVIRFPAVAEQDDEHRKAGEAIWPEKYPVEELQRTKNVVGSYDWSSLYQQTPILSENQEFRQEWFRYRTMEDISHMNVRKFATIDPNFKKADDSDWTGVCRNYVNDKNQWHLRCQRYRVSSKDVIDLIFLLHSEGFEKIGIEEGAFSYVVEPFLKDEMVKRGKFPVVVPLKHHGTMKEVRIRGLIPRYETEMVYHIKGECDDLENEALSFPKGTHDDCLDAAAYQIQIAEQPDDAFQMLKAEYEDEQEIAHVGDRLGL